MISRLSPRSVSRLGRSTGSTFADGDRSLALKYKLYKSLSKSKDISSSSSSQPTTLQPVPARPPVRPLDKTPTSSTRSFFRSVSSISTQISVSTPVPDDQSNPFLETTTATPVVRRGSSARGKAATPVQDDRDNPFLSPTAVSGSASASGSRSRSTGGRGNRPYGPSVPDPSFPDPFASPSKPRQGASQVRGTPISDLMRTPGKSRARQTGPNVGNSGNTTTAAEGFLFAPSPSRLKSLLEANSLSRSPSSSSRVDRLASSPTAGPSAGSGWNGGITPRTKARKRLRGEEVEDTPKGVRRLDRMSASGFFGSDPLRDDDDEDEQDGDEDEDEVFGPTPKKSDGQRKGDFKTLFGREDDLDEDFELGMRDKKKKKNVEGNETSSGGVGKMFKKRKIERVPESVKGAGKNPANDRELGSGITNGSQDVGPPSTPSKPIGSVAQSPRSASQSTPLKGKRLVLLAQLDKQDEASLLDSEAVHAIDSSPKRQDRIRVEEDLVREIEWSDSDPDLDSEVPNGMALDTAPKRRTTKVKIEPYRLDQQRRIAAAGGNIEARDLRNGGRQFERTTSSASIGSKVKTVVRNPEAFDEEDDENRDEAEGLSRLSIRSPENDILRKTMAYHERKAMAIFSTKAANDLRLKRRGIEIYAAGEGFEGENEDGEVDDYGREDEGSEGDDDWDSEPEGWKKVGLGVDDDW